MLTSMSDIKTKLDKSIGAVWSMNAIAQKIGIVRALGKSSDARVALMQIIARVVDQGSRLSVVRFAERQAICEILNIYKNLSWIAKHQE